MSASVLFESWWEFDNNVLGVIFLLQACHKQVKNTDSCSWHFIQYTSYVYILGVKCLYNPYPYLCSYSNILIPILFVSVCLFLPPTVRNLHEPAQKNSPAVNQLSLTTASWSWKQHSRISLSLPLGSVSWTASDGSTEPRLSSFTVRGSTIKTLHLEYIHFFSLIWPRFCSTWF